MLVGKTPATAARDAVQAGRYLKGLGFAAIAWLTGPAVASGQDAQPWLIKEFRVVAVEPAGEVEGDGWMARRIEEMMRTIRTETGYDPDFPWIWDEPAAPVPGVENAKREIETVLGEAASKFESWGFPPPALEPIVQTEGGGSAYRVYLVAGPDVAPGLYHSHPCGQGLREAVLVLGADNALGDNGSLTRAGTIAAIHELVHAVQYPLAAYSCGYGRPGQWVGEGTAHAIALDIAMQLPQWGGTSLGEDWWKPWGARLYSERLPVPGTTGALRGYMSLSFWRFLAEYEQSRPTFPGPEAGAVDYSYMPRLLDRDLSPRDCYSERDPCDAELRWIDAGLRAQFGLPLRELYARFIQAYALYGEGRVHSREGGSVSAWRKKWLRRSFAHDDGEGCAEVSLDRTPEGRQKTFTVPRFPDVAARCWAVELEGFENDVMLSVTVSYRPGTEALLEQLTAVMADGSGRIDRAEVRTVADIPEASWYYNHLSTGDPALFLLTNVADSPDATRGLANLSVTFTVFETNALVGVSGPGVSGRPGASGGPAVSGASGPNFEVEDWWYGVDGSEQLARVAAAYGEPAPPGNACRISLTLTSRDANGERLIQVPLDGWVPAPLAPGVWPIVPGHAARENPFGVFQTNVGLSCVYGGCYEWETDDPMNPVDTLPYLRMMDFHGEVEIKDVSRSHVAGHFDITASADAKYAGLALTGVFNVTLKGPDSRVSDGGKLRLPELPVDHQCAPSDRDSRPGGVAGGGGGDQNGADEGADNRGGGEPSPEGHEEPAADQGGKRPVETGRKPAGKAEGEAPGQAGEPLPAHGEHSSTGEYSRESFLLCEPIEEHREELAGIIGIEPDLDRRVKGLGAQCFVRGTDFGFVSVELPPAITPSIAMHARGFGEETNPVPPLGSDAVFVDARLQPHVIFELGGLIIDVGAEAAEVPSRETMIELATRIRDLLVEANR